jgi:hypothetical protein
MMAVAARDGLMELDGPVTVYSFGGKDGGFHSHTFASAPIDVRRNVITTAAIAFDKLTRIVEQSDTGLEQAHGVLDQIAAGFAAAAERLRPEVTDEA